MKVLLEKSSVNGVTIHWLDLWEHVDPKPGFRYPKLLDSLQIHIENGLQVSEGIKPFLLQEAKHDMPPAWQILSTQ